MDVPEGRKLNYTCLAPPPDGLIVAVGAQGEVARSVADDRTKRAFNVPELVTLIRASGGDWSPNGGGYGATLWDAVRLALLTGLRAAELADLRIRDLIEDRTVIAVPGGKTRNARRTVPLPQVARDVIAARLAVLPDTSPDAPLWPEPPVLGLTGSRGGKLSDRFRTAHERLLPDAGGVDLHSLRRSYATMLEAAMNAGGRVNPTLITTLLGQARGTLALDRYSSGATLQALKLAVTDLQAMGIPSDVAAALVETQNQRPTWSASSRPHPGYRLQLAHDHPLQPAPRIPEALGMHNEIVEFVKAGKPAVAVFMEPGVIPERFLQDELEPAPKPAALGPL